MAKIPAPDSTEYPRFPEMEPIAVTITEFKDHEPSTYEGVTREQYPVVLTPTDPEFSAYGRIFAYLTRSWHEMAGNGTAGLRNLVNALHPADLTQEQILEFDPDEFEYVGRELTVFGKYTDKGRFKPVAYKRSKKAVPNTPAKQIVVPSSEEVLAV